MTYINPIDLIGVDIIGQPWNFSNQTGEQTHLNKLNLGTIHAHTERQEDMQGFWNRNNEELRPRLQPPYFYHNGFVLKYTDQKNEEGKPIAENVYWGEGDDKQKVTSDLMIAQAKNLRYNNLDEVTKQTQRYDYIQRRKAEGNLTPEEQIQYKKELQAKSKSEIVPQGVNPTDFIKRSLLANPLGIDKILKAKTRKDEYITSTKDIDQAVDTDDELQEKKARQTLDQIIKKAQMEKIQRSVPEKLKLLKELRKGKNKGLWPALLIKENPSNDKLNDDIKKWNQQIRDEFEQPLGREKSKFGYQLLYDVPEPKNLDDKITDREAKIEAIKKSKEEIANLKERMRQGKDRDLWPALIRPIVKIDDNTPDEDLKDIIAKNEINQKWNNDVTRGFKKYTPGWKREREKWTQKRDRVTKDERQRLENTELELELPYKSPPMPKEVQQGIGQTEQHPELTAEQRALIRNNEPFRKFMDKEMAGLKQRKGKPTRRKNPAFLALVKAYNEGRYDMVEKIMARYQDDDGLLPTDLYSKFYDSQPSKTTKQQENKESTKDIAPDIRSKKSPDEIRSIMGNKIYQD